METINWVHRCMIVHASIAETCGELAAGLTPAGAGMWTTPLSSTGIPPAAAYISSGLVDQVLADLLVSPEALATGTGISLSDAATILDRSDISEEDPHTALERLGFKLIAVGEL